MRLGRANIGEIEYWFRPGTSDKKTFEEVVGKNVYQKRGMRILQGEEWADCGANVGAFTVLAAGLGANVTAYEPDPGNCKMIEKNLALNKLDANIVNAGLVHNDIKRANLYAGNNGNTWRNSMLKNWNGKGLVVDTLNFDDSIKDGICVKMDIEGMEMPILENTKRIFSKMVYEWSFDIDPSLSRFWKIIDRQKSDYEVAFEEHRTCYDDKREVLWQKSWFPACTNVFLFKKK